MTRVAVVGAGMVGATTAARIAEARLCDHVALIDVAGDLARAMALDIGSSLPLLGSDTMLTGGESYEGARGADVVVITAGRPRQPGQSRADLLEGNGRIVAEVCREVRAAAPDAVVIVVTNPLDEMTTLAQDALGFPPERVVGMAGPARHRALPPLPGRARRSAREQRRGAHAGLARRHDGAALAHGDDRRPPGERGARRGRARRGRPAHARRRRRGRAAAAARIGLLGAERRGDADGARDPARRAGRAADRGAAVGPVRHRRRLRRRARAARSRRGLGDRHRRASTRPRSRRCAPRRRRCGAGWPICTSCGSCASVAPTVPAASSTQPPASLAEAVRRSLL